MIDYSTNTKLFGVIGDPMRQIVSHNAHNAIYQHYGLNAICLPITLKKGRTPEFLSAAKTLHFNGFTVTMPHKSDIVPYLDEAEDNVRLFHSSNVVTVDENGRTHGYSFDGFAMCEAFETTGAKIMGRKALILGAGGISGVVAEELAKRGAREITILNRTEKKAENVAQMIKSRYDIPIIPGPLIKDALDQAAANCDIVMQCTSLGMAGFNADFEYLGFLDKLLPYSVIVEAQFSPANTTLLKYAKNLGLTAINGREMLSCQIEQIIRTLTGFTITKEGKELARQAFAGEI